MNMIDTAKAARYTMMSGKTSFRFAPCILRDSGQSLIELALVAPIFFALLLGAVEFGRLAYDSIEVSNAARAGVAYGAQSAATAVDTAGIRQAAINDGANITGLNVSPTQFCSCSGSPASHVDCSNAATTCGSARVLSYVEVQTSASIDPLIHLPGFPTTFNLNGQAIMRVEQ
jgi:Flp pilus assembly protein TadG